MLKFDYIPVKRSFGFAIVGSIKLALRIVYNVDDNDLL